MAAAIASESGDLWPRDATGVSLIAGKVTHSGTSGALSNMQESQVGVHNKTQLAMASNSRGPPYSV